MAERSDVTPDETQVKLEDHNGGVKPAVADDVNQEELAGTRLLFHRDPVTGKYSENVILSPTPTSSPNGRSSKPRR
jgi:hypothetical protein